MKKIILSIGTRPEIIKMAPLYHALKDLGVKPLLLHTGQHDDMAEPLYDFFNIKPDFVIKLRSKLFHARPKGSDLANLSALLFKKISPIFTEVNPAIVAVHGDTLSALISAMCAFYGKIDIAHIEAGLRSHQRYQPFPEEKNREIIAHLARWHFAPTPTAVQNLMAEGVKQTDIFMVGNTVVDASILGIKHLEKLQSESHTLLPKKLKSLQNVAADKKILLVTAHRRENQEENIGNIARAVREILEADEEFLVVWPVHPSPKIGIAVRQVFDNVSENVKKRLYLTKPLQYPVLLWVLKRSWLILTDSGGIQEEAVSLNIPVFVLREVTERPEVIEVNAGKLIGAAKNNIVKHVTDIHKDNAEYEKMQKTKSPFGDGKAANKIASVLLEYL